MITRTNSTLMKQAFRNESLLEFWGITFICAYYYLVAQAVTLDDAFIYFRVVNNFLHTGKPVFNIGDTYLIVTSPLWTALLVLGKIVCPFFNLTLIAKLWWVILLMAASFLGYLAFYPFIGRWAVFISCPFFLSPIVRTMTGNEIALLYLAIFGMLWATVYYKYYMIGFFLGVGYLSRGEFIFIIIPVLFHFILNRKTRLFSPKQLIFILIKIGFIMSSMILLWHGYYFITFHSLFPKTFEVKMLQGQSGDWILFHQAIMMYLEWVLGGRNYLLLFAFIGALWQPYLFVFMATYTLCHSIAYSILKIPYYHWYYYDYYIFVLILIFWGLFYTLETFYKLLVKRIGTDKWKMGGYRATLLCSISMVIVINWIFPINFNLFLPRYIVNVYQNNNMDNRGNSYAEISKRLLKESHSDDIILSNEVGIFSYFLENSEIRDVNGLASPNVNLSNMNNWAYFVDLYQPRFLILGGQEALKIFEFNHHLYVYDRHFTIPQDSSHMEVTVYIKSSERTAGDEIEILQEIKSKSRYSPDVHYAVINNEIALFCHSPFESSVQVLQNARTFEMEIGFMSLLDVFEKASMIANGVRLKLFAEQNNLREEQLGIYTIVPFQAKQMSPPLDVKVNLPIDVIRIKIILDPIDNNSSYDWAYINKIKFR